MHPSSLRVKLNVLERLLFPPTFLNLDKLRRRLEGKTVLITGASSGIGEQVAYALAEIKVHLIVVARRADKLLDLQRHIEAKAAKVTVFPADLRDEQQLEKLLAFLHQLPNGLDVVVSNAGHSIKRPIRDSFDRVHDFTRTMKINYFAPVQLMMSAVPLLQKNQGHLINVSTVSALLIPIPHWAAYLASKSAFDMWFRSAAPELNGMGISTTSVYLPLVRTPMILPTAAYEKLPAMHPRHAANLIIKSIYTKKKTYQPWWLIFGQLSCVLFRPIWEWLMARRLNRRSKRD